MSDDPAVQPVLARSLLREVRADPQHLPEILALFAVRRLGPVARRTMAGLPDAEPAALQARVVARGTRATVAEGSFVGGPFLLLVPVAFCAALLRQARTILELAALDGRDPTTRGRAAELLVLQGVYDDVERADAALDARCGERAGLSKSAEDPADADPVAGGRLRRPVALWNLILRMARLLGLITPAQTTGRRPRLVQAARWLLLGVVFVVGLVAPLVWLPYMAMSYERATAGLMDRAVRFYFAEPSPTGRRRRHLSPGALAGAVRAVLSLLVPVVLFLGVLAGDLRLAGSNWPVLGIVLTASSLAVGGMWLWRRKRRFTSG
ncbi:hypothetical protein [Streptomyces justiciae]|uniref:hypothetical protein n=1 Tax=Streptomyces justiciae TaxID=2780140 RepID=UPI00187E7E2F|nr:hypothetical protein [Streptomyces justiciae]MBE8475592.1 hypothetical protein [Streptomyces justiciae]MCW8382514.1 hypothetical protein [Streptomyces justiciae]